MGAHSVRELTTEEEFVRAFSLVGTLYPELSEEEYLDLLPAVREHGYRQFARFDTGAMVAVAGLRPGVNFSSGAYVYVNDLVVSPDYRSRGHGSALLQFVHEWAREQGYDAVRLVASKKRTDAHRFYEEKMAYERRGFYFRKRLRDGGSSGP